MTAAVAPTGKTTTATRQRRWAVSLIWLGLLLIVATTVAAVLFAALDIGGTKESQFGSTTVFSLILFVLQAFSFFAVGSLLTLRQPDNIVGWLCLVIALVWFTIAAASLASEWALSEGQLGLTNWLGILGGLWVVPVGLMATHLPLRLPDGTHLSPRWRRFSWVCTGIIVVIGLGIVTLPGPVDGLPGTENPLGTAALEFLTPVFVLLPLSFLISIASLVVRYRRSDGVQRLQIRTIAFGGLIFLVVFLAGLSNMIGLYPSGGTLELVFQDLAVFVYNAIPVSIAIAVLRYRLYDIGVVINRALVYTALTATLAATYFATVLLLQFAVQPLTERSDLAVAGSTLAVAALFRPARTRIQGWVDRRFYRRRYDATRTVQEFSAGLREQVNLDELGDESRTVVRATMQPAHVSLWLRQS